MNNNILYTGTEVKTMNWRIRLIWIICILVVLLIISLIFLLNKNLESFGYTKLMNILSGAATLLSIVLACFSIAFSYHSSNVLDSKTAQIESSVNSISKVCEHLDKRYEDLNKNMKMYGNLSNIPYSAEDTNNINNKFKNPELTNTSTTQTHEET